MQTTRWLDKYNKELSSVIEKIISFKENYGVETGEKNFKFEKVFKENQVININSRNISFNKINISYDIVDAGEQPEEDRTTRKEEFLLIYSTGININYIINKNTSASTLIRKLNGYSGKNEVIKNMLNLDSDFFIWLISKVYNGENNIETSKDTNIQINSIKGLKGNTDDLLNKVTADGETLMNVISALSFLLESNKINQIKIDVEYKEHQNIALTLNKTLTIDTDLKNYSGLLLEEEREMSFCKLLLITYLELIPQLFQAYQEEKKEELWSSQKYIDFLETIGSDISTRIKEKINLYKEN